jgi:hypothetical protein
MHPIFWNELSVDFNFVGLLMGCLMVTGEPYLTKGVGSSYSDDIAVI